MAKFISSDAIYQALYDMGAVEEEPKNVRRVVIDLECGRVARILMEKYADDEKLIVGLEAGFRVEQATAAPGEKR